MNQNRSRFNLHNLSIQFSLIAIGIPTLVLAIFGLYQIKTQTIAFETEALGNFDLEKNGKLVQLPISFKGEHIGTLEITATTQLLTQRVERLKKSAPWNLKSNSTGRPLWH